jgi:hypothetical protein
MQAEPNRPNRSSAEAGFRSDIFPSRIWPIPVPLASLRKLAGLNLHLDQTVLPDSHVGRHAVLAVIEENDHAIGVHGLADEELVVLEVGDDLLGER